MAQLQYIPNQQIDKAKWDACIQASANGLLYASAIYLDTMADNWDALVMNNYTYVMPLTWKKKYGIYYLYQPAFTASLGVFGPAVTPAILTTFLQAIPKKFKYWDVYLNHGNTQAHPPFTLYQRTNYVLNLQPGYDELYKNYRENIRRNIRKTIQLKCIVKKEVALKDIIDLAQLQLSTITSLAPAAYQHFTSLYHYLQQRKQACSYGVYAANGQLLASAVFFTDTKRAYYILVGNHPNGKTIGASHALVDAFIKDHAGQQLLLDFEGSDIRSLAFFYSSFGAAAEIYTGLKLNRLPWWLRLFKK
jgi:hypothetical protein